MDFRNIGILTVLSMYVLVCVHAKPDCSDTLNCQATTNKVCNGHGVCECGTCKCDSPYKGPTCEECPTCLTPCELFKSCVGCKVFGTGHMSVMDCIDQCDLMANYIPVYPEDFDITKHADGLQLCRHTNKDQCVESFKIGDMTDGYRDLHVRTETECPTIDDYEPKYEPIDEEVDITDEVVVVDGGGATDGDTDGRKAKDSNVDNKPESRSETTTDDGSVRTSIAQENDMDMKVTEVDDPGKGDTGTGNQEVEGAGAVSGDDKSGCSGLTASVVMMCLSVVAWCL